MRALGKTGGFPQDAIHHASRFISVGSDLWKIAVQRINKNAPYDTRAAYRDGWGHAGTGKKIVFQDEECLLDILNELPPEIPIMDLLQDDIYQIISENFRRSNQSVFGCTKQNMEDAREFFSYFCSADTTANDIIGKLRTYFFDLVDHAVQKPEDFYATASTWGTDPASGIQRIFVESEIVSLKKVLKKLKLPPQQLAEMSSWLDNSQARHKTIVTEHYQPYIEKIWQEQKAASEARAEEHRLERLEQKEKPQSRRNYSIILTDTGQGRFVVHTPGSAPPTRMDWLHWLQSVDKIGAKPSDVEMDCLNWVVTIRNPKALRIIRELPGTSSKDITLPNRRMGVDLAAYDDPKPPIHPSLTQG